MMQDLWKHSSTARELLEEGRKEGRVEGRKEEVLRLTRLALERRFGSLDEELVQAFEQMDIPALEDLVLDATLTLEQVRARVGLHE